MSKDPAFPFYAGDFIMGTVLMTDAEVGKYIKLLCIQHQHGGVIPQQEFNDYIGECQKVRRKFTECEDGFYNERLMKEMIKRQKKSSNLSANALKRWKNEMQKQCNCTANAMQPETENEIKEEIEEETDAIKLFKAFFADRELLSGPTPAERKELVQALKLQPLEDWLPYCSERIRRKKQGEKVQERIKFFFESDFRNYEERATIDDREYYYAQCPDVPEHRVICEKGQFMTCKKCEGRPVMQVYKMTEAQKKFAQKKTP